MTLTGEAGLAIIAGSDTTGTALANAMYYLIAHPGCMRRLRAELDQAAGEGAGAAYDVDIEADKLPELRFLQAVINETLRLQPALPNGVQRTPPSEGGDVVVVGQYECRFSLRDHGSDDLIVLFLSGPQSKSPRGAVRR